MTYCYKCKCGNRFEVQCRASERQSEYACPKCSTLAERDYVAENAGTQNRSFEIHSIALAENDVAKASERAKKHGVPTRFDDVGCPIFTSTGHQRKYMKMMGDSGAMPGRVIDRNAYY